MTPAESANWAALKVQHDVANAIWWYLYGGTRRGN